MPQTAIPIAEPIIDDDPLPVAELIEEPPVRRRSRIAALASAIEWLFGAAALILGLAFLAALPVGQFLVFGYLLESEERVARTGRLRDGFVGVRKAARLGGIAAGVGLCWLPLWLVASTAAAAQVIDPGGLAARRWSAALTILSVLFVLHVSAACLRGGRFRYFLNPFNLFWLVRRLFRGGLYREARDGVWETVTRLRLPYYFWLGLRGFVGAFAWLVLPAALLAQGHRTPAVGILGAGLLAVVVLYLPFLQARFARENRLRVYLGVRPVRADFRRAPVAFAVAGGCCSFPPCRST